MQRTTRMSVPASFVSLAKYTRWWVGYAADRTVMGVFVFGPGSLIAMPFAVMRGWDVFAAFFLLFLYAVAVFLLPALRWRFERRTEGRAGRHASETPPWS